jgi:hypothetical protein
MDVILWTMGDKSPKAAHKHAAQKQAKAANQKKSNPASAKQVPKPKQ